MNNSKSDLLHALSLESKKIKSNEETNTDFVTLFNGSIDGWKMIGNGNFVIIFEYLDDKKQQPLLKAQGDMGLLYYYKKKFRLNCRLEWVVTHLEDNSGIFVRFSNPHSNPWHAVNHGQEIQIDDQARSNREPLNMIGAVYGFMGPSIVASKSGECWNNLSVFVKGQIYTVIINDEKVIDGFQANRNKEGYIGLQNHEDKSTVYFKNIFVKTIS